MGGHPSSRDPGPGADTLDGLVAEAGADEAGGASDAGASQEHLDLVILRVGARWFGVRADQVAEVVIKGFVTRLPLAPSYVEGVTVVHGRLVTVVDLAGLLRDIPKGESGTMLPRLVVVARDDLEIALVTDEARGIVEAEPVPTSARPDASGPERAVVGMAQWGDVLVSVLDGPTLVDVVAAERA